MRLLTFTVIAATILLTGTILASISIEEADAARASKPKEIVVVGSKVKEVIREAGLRSDALESCSVIAYDDNGRIVRTIEAQANDGGVVKIRDIESEAVMVDVFCFFESGLTGKADDVMLKIRGTTDIHIKPIRLD